MLLKTQPSGYPSDVFLFSVIDVFFCSLFVLMRLSAWNLDRLTNEPEAGIPDPCKACEISRVDYVLYRRPKILGI